MVLDKNNGNIKKQVRFSGNNFSNSITDFIPYTPDTLWIGTNSGIVWMNIHNYSYGHIKVPSELEWMENTRTRYFFEDSKTNLWISFGKINSLVRYNRSERSFTDISPENNPLLKITYVFSISEDLQGNIWLAGDGLCRWNSRKQMVDTLIPYPKVSKLLLNYMMILDRDSANNLWLSSFENVLMQFNCTSLKMYLRKQENNFIDGNTVTSSPIINNNIWLGTDNGISAFNIKNYGVKQFTYTDGLPSVAISSVRKGSFYDRSENRVYIGAKHLLFSFIPDVSLSHNIAPELYIEKINVRDSVFVPSRGDIHLEYYQNNVTIAFNTVNFTDPEENRYAWRTLNGTDTSWNDFNEQTSLTLANMAGGWHTVQIKLFSINNHWPQQLKSIRFFIHPPFWKTIWFLALLSILIACTVYLLYRIRVNSITKKEREKAHVQRLIAEEYKNRLELEQISNYFSFHMADKKSADEVLWDVAKNLIGRMNYEECIIYLWNSDKSRMIQKAAYGPKGSPNAIEMQFFDVVPGQGVVGHVMNTKEPLPDRGNGYG